MKKYIFVIILLTTLGVISFVGAATKGDPFKTVWDAINNLQTQIDNIQLIPGPTGPQGPPGEPSWDEARISSIEARLDSLENATTLSLFEYYNTGDNDVNSVVDPKWEAQTFTPQISHIIKKVKIKIYRLGLPGIVSVGIRATDAEGKPSGMDLVSGTIDGDTFTTDSVGAWYDIDLGSGTILSSGVKYAIVLGNSASGWARWRVAVPSSYEGGTCATSFDSGNTWVLCGNDTMFEEWGHI